LYKISLQSELPEEKKKKKKKEKWKKEEKRKNGCSGSMSYRFWRQQSSSPVYDKISPKINFSHLGFSFEIQKQVH
jgi:hypothetical protein